MHAFISLFWSIFKSQPILLPVVYFFIVEERARPEKESQTCIPSPETKCSHSIWLDAQYSATPAASSLQRLLAVDSACFSTEYTDGAYYKQPGWRYKPLYSR